MADSFFKPLIASAAMSALLAGCVGASERYPSLAIRDFERINGTFEPVDPILEPSPAPAGQGTQLEYLIAQAQTAHNAFMEAVPAARSLVAAIDAKDPESKAWGDAQVALSSLDSHRSQAAIALGDLDLLYANASTDFVEREAIAEARETVIATIVEEDAILMELRGRADQ